MGIFSRGEQGKWDRQIANNRLSFDPESREIADRMEDCPRNPRNGGGGFRDHKNYR